MTFRPLASNWKTVTIEYSDNLTKNSVNIAGITIHYSSEFRAKLSCMEIGNKFAIFRNSAIMLFLHCF